MDDSWDSYICGRIRDVERSVKEVRDLLEKLIDSLGLKIEDKGKVIVKKEINEKKK